MVYFQDSFVMQPQLALTSQSCGGIIGMCHHAGLRVFFIKEKKNTSNRLVCLAASTFDFFHISLSSNEFFFLSKKSVYCQPEPNDYRASCQELFQRLSQVVIGERSSLQRRLWTTSRPYNEMIHTWVSSSSASNLGEDCMAPRAIKFPTIFIICTLELLMIPGSSWISSSYGAPSSQWLSPWKTAVLSGRGSGHMPECGCHQLKCAG